MESLEDSIRTRLIESGVSSLGLDSKRYSKVLDETAKTFSSNMIRLYLSAMSVAQGETPKKAAETGDALARLFSPLLEDAGAMETGADKTDGVVKPYEMSSEFKAIVYKLLSPSKLKADIREQYSSNWLNDMKKEFNTNLSSTPNENLKNSLDKLLQDAALAHEKHDKLVESLVSHAKTYGLESALDENTILDMERKITPNIDEYASNFMQIIENTQYIIHASMQSLMQSKSYNIALEQPQNMSQGNLIMLQIVTKNTAVAYIHSLKLIFNYLYDRMLDYASKLYGSEAVIEYKKSHKVQRPEKLKFDLTVSGQSPAQSAGGPYKRKPQDKYDPSYG